MKKTLIIWLVIFVVGMFLASCGQQKTPSNISPGGTLPGPVATVSDTAGIKCDPVTTNLDNTVVTSVVHYRLYCFAITGGLQSYNLADATFFVNANGTQIMWVDVPFPHDGSYNCGWTAYDDTDESALSAVLGVKKTGDVYTRLN